MNPSYAYLYDDFLADRPFERDLAAIETSLSSLGIFGRIGRLALFRSAKELVAGMVREGATTVVVVGNDTTLDRVMWFLPDLPVTVGYLPISGPSSIAEFLNIPVGVASCETLAARHVETLDVGKVDDRYFLQEISLPATSAALEIEGQYRISPSLGGSLSIRNLGGKTATGFVAADAKDGMLEAVVSPAPSQDRPSRWRKPAATPETRMLFAHGVLISESPMEASVDNHALSGFRFPVEIVPHRLNIVTGRAHHSARGDGGLRKTRKVGTFRVAK